MLKSQLAWLGETLDINPVVRLLPRFDTTVGLRDPQPGDRSAICAAHFRGRIIKPALLIDGRVCGT